VELRQYLWDERLEESPTNGVLARKNWKGKDLIGGTFVIAESTSERRNSVLGFHED
jgi:hypothetical protein